MLDSITGTLSEHDLEALAEMMADNPEFAKKLVDAISDKLDEKFGRKQGDIFFELDELKEGQKKILDKLEDHYKQFGTLDHNLQMFADRQEILAGDTEKRLLKAIDDRLGSGAERRRA